MLIGYYQKNKERLQKKRLVKGIFKEEKSKKVNMLMKDIEISQKKKKSYKLSGWS